MPIAPAHSKQEVLRHSGVVRVTHWLTVLAFVALLVSGIEILISHPRFYWGEVGNVLTRPLFTLPIPASRSTVPTKYAYVLPDQNGWSRALHIQAAWALVLTGLLYGVSSVSTDHFRKDLLPKTSDMTWQTLRDTGVKYFRRAPPGERAGYSYNVVQRIVYLGVIFLLFPLMIWTGLAMSPAFVSAFPLTVSILGGRQSARTLHFFVSWFLVIFLVGHVTMVVLAGFWSRMQAMITGRVAMRRERA